MKLMHLSDLHLGKRVNEFPMQEDQQYILLEILRIIGQEKPDGVIIAGDVYDKAVPSAEAVSLLDDFLKRLAAMKQKVYMIYGNHDSAERVAFGGEFFQLGGIHVSPVFSGSIEPCPLADEYGEAKIWMLPFVKPVDVRHAYPEESVSDYTDAVRQVIGHMNMDPSDRNILVAHQFVTGATRSESEDVSVGGLDNVDASVFDQFDYVALGHLHGPQHIGRETIRYCGTPIKYSFSEKDHIKSLTVVELKEKGNVEIRMIPLKPDDYLHVVLTDEDDVPDAMARMRTIYPNIMKIDYDNQRTQASSDVGGAGDIEHKSEIELFNEFFEKQNGQPLSDEQRSFAEEILEGLKEGKA